MIALYGRPQSVCGGCSRREMLRVGGLSALGVTLPGLLRARVLGGDTGPPELPAGGRARACILVFLFGGPSHLDTWDMKPGAPSNIRGEFSPIATSVPGISICEHFAELARHADKFAIIRSMYHEHPRHGWGLYYMLTGHRHLRPEIDAPPTREDFPCLGSLAVKYLPRRGGLHQAVTLPRWNRFNDLPNDYAGQHGGFLGGAYDPWLLQIDPDEAGNFEAPGVVLPPDVSLNRLDRRRELLASLDRRIAMLGERPLARTTDALYEQAFSLVSSPEARRAFDLSEEDDGLRDCYGRHPLGQGLLLARRLVEAGVALVSVNWHNDGSDVKSPFWDTHIDNFAALRERLIPPTDRALAGLLTDLDERGLLESTLVVVMGEFGRSPRVGHVVINGATSSSGRDHWPHAYSVLVAGGGVRGGQVVGASDRLGEYVAESPVTPGDLSATLLHCLGVDPARELTSPDGRRYRLSEGRVVRALF